MFPKISIRIDDTQPNHHLWNNNGTWFMYYVVHLSSAKKKRVRCSLGTKDLEEARHLRDVFLSGVRLRGIETEAPPYGEFAALHATL